MCYMDEYRNTGWPTMFAAVPEKGSKVMSMDGRHVLRVHNVTHRIDQLTHEPGIIVELVTRPMA